MKRYLSLIAAVVLSFSASAQQMEVVELAANTVSNLLSTPKIIDNITVLATTTNNTIVKFYDSSAVSTSIVRAAYTRYASYATNYNVVFTNAAGLLVTNTFVGRFTAPTDVSAVTNERPKVLTLVIPASSQVSQDVTIQTLRGLTAVPTYGAIVTVTYRNIE